MQFSVTPTPIERVIVLRKRNHLIWEAEGVTNPGVARLDNGQIAMIYRGCGGDKIGYLGACLLDKEGREVIADTRLEDPLAIHDDSFPDGFGDPRISKVADDYYIFANGRNNAVLN